MLPFGSTLVSTCRDAECTGVALLPFYLPESLEVLSIRDGIAFHGLAMYFPGSFKRLINAIEFHGDANQDKRPFSLSCHIPAYNCCSITTAHHHRL